MNQETLKAAKDIDEQISKLHSEIEKLCKPRITISVHGVNGQGSYQFATIGTEANCEHPDAGAAAAFLAALIDRRKQASSKLHVQFNAL